ncbi:hypothetical protein ACFQ0B_78815 [Nonomuraea thailandensis]
MSREMSAINATEEQHNARAFSTLVPPAQEAAIYQTMARST